MTSHVEPQIAQSNMKEAVALMDIFEIHGIQLSSLLVCNKRMVSCTELNRDPSFRRQNPKLGETKSERKRIEQYRAAIRKAQTGHYRQFVRG
jgi:hypothetical protein